VSVLASLEGEPQPYVSAVLHFRVQSLDASLSLVRLNIEVNRKALRMWLPEVTRASTDSSKKKELDSCFTNE
jgi:hypothetical protein